MKIDEALFDSLLEQAASSPRLRMHLDLRNAGGEDSQRMLNALLPGTPLPIHRHNDTDETVIILKGEMYEVFYATDGHETSRVHLCPESGEYGLQVPRGQHHGVDVLKPTVIVEFKSGAYDPNTTEDYLREK